MRCLKVMLLFFILPAICFAQEKKAFEATVDGDGVQRVVVVAGSYFFDPDHIIVKKGIPVELNVRKKPGLIPHNIVIDESEKDPKVRESLSSKPKTITFTPVETAVYKFYCDKKLLFFKSHREKGMEGVIEVIE
jgi:plastocyanin